jgi:hypothetical protein
VYVLVWNVG